MCFAPQQRPLFRHLNFQKCSDTEVFCTFWLGNVLRATTACTFSSSQFPKVDWDHHFFYTFDLEMCFAPQRREFFISHLPRRFRTRRFSKPTFRPSGATNHWKNTVFCDYSTFSRTCIFFPLTLSSDSFLWLFPRTLSLLRSSLIFFHLFFFSFLLFSSLLWSSFFFSFLLFSSLLVSSLLFSSRLFSSLRFSSLLFSSLTLPTSAFPSLHIVGSLASKLPSTI